MKDDVWKKKSAERRRLDAWSKKKNVDVRKQKHTHREEEARRLEREEERRHEWEQEMQQRQEKLMKLFFEKNRGTEGPKYASCKVAQIC